MASLVAATVVIGVVATTPASLLGATGPSCSQGQPGAAIAYGTTGTPLPSQPSAAPGSCLVTPGFATVENHIGVANDGTVLLEPAVITPGLLGSGFVTGAPGPHPWTQISPAGIAISRNDGGSWKFVAPDGQLFAANDNSFYVDPWTGRLFLGMIASQSQLLFDHVQLLSSPDDGNSWTGVNLLGFVLTENARFTSTPEATYWCGNQNVGFTSPIIIDRQCFRTLDGGRTWQMRSVLFDNLVPRHPECGSQPETFTAIDGNYPQGASDGSLYTTVQCGPIYLARSTDQAATFPVLRGADGKPVTVPIPGTANQYELRVTGTTLVLVYQVGNRLILRTSPTPTPARQPLNWSAPVTLTPASIASIDRWSVATRDGELALSYLARRTAAPAWDGYLTVMPNPLDGNTIWTAMVNDPKTPISVNPPQDAREDFIGVTIGPDQTAWASFFSPCSADPSAPTDPACKGAYVNGKPVNSALQGGNDRVLVASLKP